LNYPKIYRIPIPFFKETRGKHYLTEDEVKQLFNGIVSIEEKVDGKLGAEQLDNDIFFYEYMKYKHTIPYLKLSSWKLYFDIWDSKRFLGLNEKRSAFIQLGMSYVRIIYHGIVEYKKLLKTLPKILELKTEYGHGDSKIEGIVIKNYNKQLFGKVVNPKFEKEIDETGHWIKRKKIMNRLRRIK